MKNQIPRESFEYDTMMPYTHRLDRHSFHRESGAALVQHYTIHFGGAISPDLPSEPIRLGETHREQENKKKEVLRNKRLRKAKGLCKTGSFALHHRVLVL
jgi:hypothetical protein